MREVGGHRLEDLDRSLLVGDLLAQHLDLRQLLSRRAGQQPPIDAGLDRKWIKPGVAQWVKSACQVSSGCSARNRM